MAPRCPDCRRELDVTIRNGKRVVESHECPGPPAEPPTPRQDAPAHAPGTADGHNRWG